MLCPKCKTEMCIAATRIEASGDQSPETPTVVWRVMDLACRSPGCENYKQVVETVRHQING